MVVVLSPLHSGNSATGRRDCMILLFILSVVAGIVAGIILYFVGKWLDRKFGDN